MISDAGSLDWFCAPRFDSDACFAALIGYDEHGRWALRPTVRGLAMNPVDHPHGGGEGKSGQGNPHPVSPWGWNTKGLKTRHNKRTDNMIVQRRKNRIR